METKVCTKCKRELSINCYTKQSKTKDGLYCCCKDCKKEEQAKYRAENREKILAGKREYYQKNIEKIKKKDAMRRERDREKRRESDRIYRQNNIEKLREYDRKRAQNPERREYEKNRRENNRNYIRAQRMKWQEDNKEMRKEYAKKYRKENALWIKGKNMEYYARKRKGAKSEIFDYEDILKRDKHICHICGAYVKNGDLHFDHIVPLSRDGEHTKDNVAVSHSWCNIVKRDMLLNEFYEQAYCLLR